MHCVALVDGHIASRLRATYFQALTGRDCEFNYRRCVCSSLMAHKIGHTSRRYCLRQNLMNKVISQGQNHSEKIFLTEYTVFDKTLIITCR